MPTYLDASFFKDVKTEMEVYVNDYAQLSERARIIEERETKMLDDTEESFEILEKFGAIM